MRLKELNKQLRTQPFKGLKQIIKKKEFRGDFQYLAVPSPNMNNDVMNTLQSIDSHGRYAHGEHRQSQTLEKDKDGNIIEFVDKKNRLNFNHELESKSGSLNSHKDLLSIEKRSKSELKGKDGKS